jgi:hypothetical protein
MCASVSAVPSGVTAVLKPARCSAIHVYIAFGDDQAGAAHVSIARGMRAGDRQPVKDAPLAAIPSHHPLDGPGAKPTSGATFGALPTHSALRA